jgi:hypothetical protein
VKTAACQGLSQVMRLNCLKFLIFYALFLPRTAMVVWPAPIQYLFPLPGSDSLPVKTPVICRFETLTPEQVGNPGSFIQVTGEQSGRMRGEIVLSTDRKTWIFKPLTPFFPGERVHVAIQPAVHVEDSSLYTINTYFYVILQSEHATRLPKSSAYDGSEFRFNYPKQPGSDIHQIRMIQGVAVPSDFPEIDIAVHEQTGDGFIFCNNWNWRDGTVYSMILNNDGTPVWYLRHTDERRDMKVQQGLLLMMVREIGNSRCGYIALDPTYTAVDTFFAPEGYAFDEHEMQLLPNGHYLLIGIDYRDVDLSQIIENGDKNTRITGNSLIEMDEADNPVFIWRCWDHFKVEDHVRALPPKLITDYVHMNSIDVDLDGHYIISSRHLNEITKINRHTGEIVWRLGGDHDEFTWINDAFRLSHQHDCRVISSGHYTVFDNGNTREPQFSRALELSVNADERTVSKVWEFRDDPDKYAWFSGNVQRLPNGNTVIGWGVDYLPRMTEVTPENQRVYEMNFRQPAHCYRIYRFPWQGKALSPTLILESSTAQLNLIFNQFGDPDVDFYRIYGGIHPETEEVLAQSTLPCYTFGQEDLIQGQTYYFRVTSVNKAGKESVYSNEVSVPVFFVAPGINLIRNGDFISGLQDWIFYSGGSAMAEALPDNNELSVQIMKAGDNPGDIQLRQEPVELIHGEHYRFEFDAVAEKNRMIEARIEKSDGSDNYSQTGSMYIKNRMDHYIFEFVMEKSTDSQARLVFNLADHMADVTLDNVSLMRLANTVIAQREAPAPEIFSMKPIRPNPLNLTAVITYTLSQHGAVRIVIADITGRTVARLLNKEQNAGTYTLNWQAAENSSGMYFVIAECGKSRIVRKLTVIK